MNKGGKDLDVFPFGRSQTSHSQNDQALDQKCDEQGNGLHEDDWDGHEKFQSEEEMYAAFSKYYMFNVGPETRLKVIKFKVL